VRRPDVQILSRSGYYAIPPEEIVLLSPADKNCSRISDSADESRLPISFHSVHSEAAMVYTQFRSRSRFRRRQ
jgi:hypothetical protein